MESEGRIPQRAMASAADNSGATRRAWRRTILYVRCSVRFRLLQRWSQEAAEARERKDNASRGQSQPQASLSDYERIGVLGHGGAAVVYLVRHITTQILFAMKVQACSLQQPWTRRTCNAQREKHILRLVHHHPFVCDLHESFHDSARLYLILGFQRGGTLDDVRVHCGGKLSEQAVRFYATEIIQALEYIHTMGFVYRDLKPQNVLIGGDGHIRLTDFGVAHEGLPFGLSRLHRYINTGDAAKPLGTPTTASPSTDGDHTVGLVDEMDSDSDDEASQDSEQDRYDDCHQQQQYPHGGVDDRVRLRSNSLVGTLAFMPPEMIQQATVQSTDVDWWALGCLLYELLYGVSPFQQSDMQPTTSTKDLFRRILTGKLHFPAFPRVSGHWKDLLRGLLTVDPNRRLGHRGGSTEIKAHACFKGINWALLHHNTIDKPVRVTTQEYCGNCLVRHYQEARSHSVEPPMDNHEPSDEDTTAWRRWNEREKTTHVQCTAHEVALPLVRYERGSDEALSGRIHSFLRSWSMPFMDAASRATQPSIKTKVSNWLDLISTKTNQAIL